MEDRISELEDKVNVLEQSDEKTRKGKRERE
jgi:hypothetical protein